MTSPPAPPPLAYLALPVTSIRPSSFQARENFDSDRLKSLAASMQQEGLIQPITVRRVADDGKHPAYELISGERRLRAAQMLGWETIEARVITCRSEAEAAAKGLIENLQRQDLNPIEEAEGFAELQRIDPKGWTQVRIAEAFGRTAGYISQSLSLLSLPKPVLDDFRRLKITRCHGLELLRLRTPSQQIEVASHIDERTTVAQTRRVVNRVLKHSAVSDHRLPVKVAIPEDPLKELWPGLLVGADPVVSGIWGVSYGVQQIMAAVHRVGWCFRVSPLQEGSRRELGAWFQKIGQALLSEESN